MLDVGCWILNVFKLRNFSWLVVFLFSLALAQAATAGILISEFLASNDGLLKDEDGESPGWIELYNTGPGTTNLGGWHLTDSPGNPLRWTFPSTNLPTGSYLIVFASGKDRAVAGAQLHANFELNNGGGYLALVRPDGTTIEHAYSPGYTNQRANVSYGLELQTTTTSLIGTNVTARVLVPSNSSLGLTWTSRTFVDSSWYVSNTPVAFAVGTIATPVVAIDINERAVDPV